MQFINSSLSSGTGGGVAYAAHIGGFISGIILLGTTGESPTLDIDEKKSSDLERQLNQSKINAEKINNFDVKKELSSFDLIINSSSLGHHSNPGNPLPEIEMCKEGVIFFDAIYTPLNTLFLKQAFKSNYTIISGLDLFLFQGFESFMLFTDKFDLKDELFLLYEKLKSNYSNFLEKT